MSNAKEDPTKRLREKLHEIEGELKEKISLCPAAQESNHMYRITAEKNPVKSLQISYSVFFQWEDMKILQKSSPIQSLHIVS